MFLHIAKHDDIDIKSELLSILEKTNDKYDEGMVNFYIGLNAYINLKENLDEIKFGEECTKKAEKCFSEIEASLEADICFVLCDKYARLKPGYQESKFSYVEECKAWCDRFRDIIK